MKGALNVDPIDILLVEDNPADVLLTREAFRHARVAVTVHSVPDGEKALAYLRREQSFAASPEPGMILLDLNMPRMNGWEVLEVVKNDPTLQHIPVLVLTSSAAPCDILRAYRLHANSYLVKPADMTVFSEIMGNVYRFWFRVARLPQPA